MHSISKASFVSILVTLLMGLSVTVACTKDSKKDSADKSSPKVSPSPTPVEKGDCLRAHLADDDDAEADDDDDDDDVSPSPSPSSASEDDDEDGVGSTSSSDCGKTTPPAADSPSGGGTSSGWTAGPGLEGCAAEGKAWIAVKGGSSGVCGDPLVTWCCSEDEIGRQFPSLAAKLKAEFDREATGSKPGIKKAGLKLYQCSVSGKRTTFHWANKDDTGIKYVTVYVDSAAKGGTADDTCKKVTSADLGITEETATDDDDTVEVGEDDIPTAIGALDDTSKTGILDFLKANEYRTGQHDAAVRAASAEHGKVKIFYNSRLKTSLEDFDTSHTKNSIAVMETYDNAGTTKTGYAVMAKAKEGTGASSWLFYSIAGAPGFAAEPTAYGLGVTTCVACHKASTKDHIKSTLP